MKERKAWMRKEIPEWTVLTNNVYMQWTRSMKINRHENEPGSALIETQKLSTEKCIIKDVAVFHIFTIGP